MTLQTRLDDLGHPFGANSIYVLDERRRLVPLGCDGELCISGPQVAVGYLKSPEQTAKAFIENPFKPGSVMYATGDLVRMSPSDLTITYLGRRDTQVKIRGLRVELGEIEEIVKASNDAILNVAVVKIDIGHEALIAFMECGTNTHDSDIAIIRDDSVGELSASLKQAVWLKLPTYMAPAAYVFLNRLPLATSRKLDHNALHSYFLLHEKVCKLDLHSQDGIVVPDISRTSETHLHAMIRSLWASVLRLNFGALGLDDDFYSVGGDSISAIRLASAARGVGIHLMATDVIEHPTICAMAHVSQSATVNPDFDDDDDPSITLEQMIPSDLTLMDIDQTGLDAL
jgi:aryl carrier-like protein